MRTEIQVVLLLVVASAAPAHAQSAVRAVVDDGAVWAGQSVAFELVAREELRDALLEIFDADTAIASLPLEPGDDRVHRADYRFAREGRYHYRVLAKGGVVAKSREPLLVFARTLQLSVTSEGSVNLADGEATASVSFTASPSWGVGRYTFDWRMAGTRAWSRGGRRFVANLPAGRHVVECRAFDAALRAETATVAVAIRTPPAAGELDVRVQVESERCGARCEMALRAQATNGSGDYAYRWATDIADAEAMNVGGDVLRHEYGRGPHRLRVRAIDLATSRQVTRDVVFEVPRVVVAISTHTTSTAEDRWPAAATGLGSHGVELLSRRDTRLRAERAGLTLDRLCDADAPPMPRGAPWHVLVCVDRSTARTRLAPDHSTEVVDCAGDCAIPVRDLIARAAAVVRRGRLDAMPEPPPLGVGRLVVTGAHASIDVDGLTAGRVPVDVTVESGIEHVVRIEVEGCRRVETHRIKVAAREVSRMRVERCETPRMLSIESRPTGARVLIDGQAVSSPTPISGLPVRAGRLQIELQAPGFETWTGHIDVDSRTENLVVNLRAVETPPTIVNRGNLQYLFVDGEAQGLIDRGERRALTGLKPGVYEVCLYHRTVLVAVAADGLRASNPAPNAIVFEGERALVELAPSTAEPSAGIALGVAGGVSMTLLTAGTRWVPSGTTVFSAGARARNLSILGVATTLSLDFSYFDGESQASTGDAVVPTAVIQRSIELGVLPTLPALNGRVSAGVVMQFSSYLETTNPRSDFQQTMHHLGLGLGPSVRVRALTLADRLTLELGYDFRFLLSPRELFQTFGRVHRVGMWVGWELP